MPQVPELRVGRNFVRVGDTVRVKPSRKGRRDGFVARVLTIDDVGPTVTVFGAPAGRVPATRTLPGERVARMAQTRNGTQSQRRSRPTLDKDHTETESK